jgi:hypothetical protein
MYRSFLAQLAVKNPVGEGSGKSKDDEGYYHSTSA